MMPTLIFSGTQAEASKFARDANLKHGYTVISQPYHLSRIQRGTILVVVGTYGLHPQWRSVLDAARARQMPIQSAEEFMRGAA